MLLCRIMVEWWKDPDGENFSKWMVWEIASMRETFGDAPELNLFRCPAYGFLGKTLGWEVPVVLENDTSYLMWIVYHALHLRGLAPAVMFPGYEKNNRLYISSNLHVRQRLVVNGWEYPVACLYEEGDYGYLEKKQDKGLGLASEHGMAGIAWLRYRLRVDKEEAVE